MDYVIEKFGVEKNPVVVIDDFHPDPDKLRTLSYGLQFSDLSKGFPGLRAPFDPNYMGPAMPFLQSILVDVFGLSNGVLLRECCASIVTVKPENLTVSQSIPHIDGADPMHMALLHYIDVPQKGGTGFYRHRETGFEAITPDREAQFYSSTRDVFNQDGFRSGAYITDSTDHFEKIGKIEGRYNRMVIYRGNLLHSGDINQNNDFSHDPRKARLSINTFLQGR